MDPAMRSAGSVLLKSGTRFQLTSIQMTPAKEMALRKKTDPAPVSVRLNAATIKPPSAGPTARARLLLAEFNDTASGIRSREISSGTIACHAGLFIAEPILSRKVSANSIHGEM